MELHEVRLTAVSTRPAAALLPTLLEAVDKACGWVLDHCMTSAATLQVRVETQGRALMDIYAALAAQGLELSRDSHQRLTEHCACARTHRESRARIVMLRLQIALPAELPALFQWWRCGQA